MLIMAEVTPEMGAGLRAAAVANKTSVAVEVGRRLERLAAIDAKVMNGAGWIPQVDSGFMSVPKTGPAIVQDEPLYSGPPNPWDMFRSTGGGR